jgi:hypothetical protein
MRHAISLRSAFAVAVIAGLFGAGAPTSAATPDCTGAIVPDACSTRSATVQDPARLALKEGYRLIADSKGKVSALPGDTLLAATTYPVSKILFHDYTQNMWEPPGRYCLSNGYCKDSHGDQYIDRYYSNFCGPGAAAVVLEGWELASNLPSGTYTEPSTASRKTTTYWTSTDGGRAKGRPYIMYLAEYVKPPSYGTRGMVDFRTYPDASTTPASLRDALNWEASAHGSMGSWSTYWFANKSVAASSRTEFLGDLKYDLYWGHIGIVASVNTDYLPNWPDGKNIRHSIAVIGYDDSKSLFYYMDTCGTLCGSNSNGGMHSISYTGMWSAIVAGGLGYTW